MNINKFTSVIIKPHFAVFNLFRIWDDMYQTKKI